MSKEYIGCAFAVVFREYAASGLRSSTIFWMWFLKLLFRRQALPASQEWNFSSMPSSVPSRARELYSPFRGNAGRI